MRSKKWLHDSPIVIIGSIGTYLGYLMVVNTDKLVVNLLGCLLMAISWAKPGYILSTWVVYCVSRFFKVKRNNNT